jgi:hypothetical protein
MNFNYSVANMFDFDQRWDALPGNGGMYCVPTSMINLMAFLSQKRLSKTLAPLARFCSWQLT